MPPDNPKPVAPPEEPHRAYLPPELWIRVLTHNTDLTHLWTTCRLVSRPFRDYTEQVFALHVLRDTYIDFQLEKYNLGGKSKRPEIPTSFSHFSTSGGQDDSRDSGGVYGAKGKKNDIAWFRDKRTKKDVAANSGAGAAGRNGYARVMQRWEDNVHGYRAEMPNYTIRIGRLVNDTALSGLRIDVAQRAIAFEWRPMLSLFFREQALLRTLRAQHRIDTETKIAANNVRIAKGEKLSPSDYPVPAAVAEIELRKEVRRKRLKEHHEGNERMVWAMESLKHFESENASGAGNALKMNPDLPGAGVGEKWFGSVNLVQELFLDEWSCMHRIDMKVEHLREEEE